MISNIDGITKLPTVHLPVPLLDMNTFGQKLVFFSGFTTQVLKPLLDLLTNCVIK